MPNKRSKEAGSILLALCYSCGKPGHFVSICNSLVYIIFSFAVFASQIEVKIKVGGEMSQVKSKRRKTVVVAVVLLASHWLY